MPRLHSLCLGLLVLLAPSAVSADVFLTEFMASNDVTIADEDGDFSDWIEIHNPEVAPVDLGGWYLTDNETVLTKWQLPSVSLAAGGYMVVWASDKNRVDPANPLHTNFKLSSGGEYLALVRPDGVTIEREFEPAYPPQTTDISYGLTVDLAEERCFINPTPGAVNDENPSCGVVQDLSFDFERGFYDAPIDVSIATATPLASIYYSTDGSDPTDTTGTLYTGPVPITTTTALRARGYAADLQPTVSVTHTYIYLDDVIVQDSVGLPDTWPGNYDMDPDVVNDPVYAATIKDDLKSIPTVSLVGTMDAYFDDTTGIYSHPGKRGIEWERAISTELIFPDGSPGFQVNCGTRIQGDVSRTLNKKKSMRLAFKSIYGPPVLTFPLFEDTTVGSFNKIRLRAGHQESWSFGANRTTYLRDQWIRDSHIAMGQVTPHGRFVHVYINGLYWGMYNAHEKPDEDFMASYFGGLPEDWDVLKQGLEIVNGDRVAWDQAHAIAQAGVSAPAAYADLLEYVDVDNLIDYFIVNLHAATNDWDVNNFYASRKRAPGEKFRFFVWDAEISMSSVNSNRVGIDNTNRPSAFYAAMRHNEEFRVLFGDHVHRHFFNDGALTGAQSVARFENRAAEIDRAVVGESARWGDTRKGTFYTRDDDWVLQKEWLRLAYFPQRSNVALEQFRDAGLYPEVVAPAFNQHGGQIFPGFSLEMTAPAGVRLYTTDGNDPRLAGGGISGSALDYTGPVTLNDGAVVKARVLDGTSWSALNEATFALEIPVRISELNYHPADDPTATFDDDDFEFLELTNIGPAPIDLTGFAMTDGIDFTFAAGVLTPGAYALIVKNQVAFESRYGTTHPVLGQYSGSLSNGGEEMQLEDGAGRIVHNFEYDDAWYPSTDGDGRSMVVRDVGQDLALWGQAEGWRASTFDEGSPAAAELKACSDGLDNDNDGSADFPADAGCADADQDFEDPQCNDTADNDGDGDIDLADVQCTGTEDDDESPSLGDAFVCYQVRPEIKFEKTLVTMSDPLAPTPSLNEVRKAKAVCVAAEVNGSVIKDAATALYSYDVRPERGEPPYIEQKALLIQGLGPIYLDTSKPDRLLVPSALDASAPVGAPDPASHELDNFKCYRAKQARRLPKYFPRNIVIRGTDQFEDRTYKLVKATRLCHPADLDGSGVKNLGSAMLCMKAKRASGQAKHTPIAALYTNNVFGASVGETRKVEEICVPAN